MLNGMLTVPVMLQCATNVGPGVRSGSELDTRPAWLGVGSQYAAAGSLGSGPLRSFQEMAPHSLWHATGYGRKTDPVRVRLSSQIVFLTPSGKPFRLSIKDGCQKRLGTAGKAGLTLASAGVQSAPFSLIRDVYLIRQRAIVWAQQTLSSVSHKLYLQYSGPEKLLPPIREESLTLPRRSSGGALPTPRPQIYSRRRTPTD